MMLSIRVYYKGLVVKHIELERRYGKEVQTELLGEKKTFTLEGGKKEGKGLRERERTERLVLEINRANLNFVFVLAIAAVPTKTQF